LANKLREEADDVERAADVLEILRSSEEHKEDIANARRLAKEWLKGA
jgi:hypothetical protein